MSPTRYLRSPRAGSIGREPIFSRVGRFGMRLRWIVALAVGVLLLAVGSVSIYGVTRLRDDRDKARSELVDARQSLGVQVAQLNAATELRDVYERVSAHRGRTIRGLEKQVTSTGRT